MSLRYLLDTDICIYLARNQPPAVAERLTRVPLETVAISVVTYGELAYGAERSQRTSETLAQLERFASVVRVLPLDAGVSAQYGRVRAALERRGSPPWGERSMDCSSCVGVKGHAGDRQWARVSTSKRSSSRELGSLNCPQESVWNTLCTSSSCSSLSISTSTSAASVSPSSIGAFGMYSCSALSGEILRASSAS